HVDSVLNGGMFDGVLGVVGGIQVIREFVEDHIKTKFPTAVIVFTDEEGNSFTPFAGSKYFAGLIKKEELHSLKGKYENINFADAFKRFLNNLPKDVKVIEKFPYKIINHFELHIEQGPILENEGKQIGIVTGIVGILRIWIELIGKQSHAGTTPMSMRSDPMIPASAIIKNVRDSVLKYKDMVGTVGYIDVFPNVVNVIPGRVNLGVDIRSLEIKDLDKIKDEIIAHTMIESEREKVKVNFTSYIEEPALCSSENIFAIKRAVEELGYTFMDMPSRAGHDSQIMAKISKIGMIFVPSKGGISHAPEEWTDWEDIQRGVKVLKYSILNIMKG
ncbi:Zn-dependent hydrolase, partial [Sulfolobus sp. F3]